MWFFVTNKFSITSKSVEIILDDVALNLIFLKSVLDVFIISYSIINILNLLCYYNIKSNYIIYK